MTKPNGRRNVAVKVDEGVHMQLSVLAQLEGCQIPDVIRQAVTEHLDRKRAELAERSADVLAEIERDAEARRAAVAALVAPHHPAADMTAAEQPKLEVVEGNGKERPKRTAKATT